jgi:hypothetical protein
MDDQEILEQNYVAYFREERIFAKWRHKQVIEFILYREWETNNSQGKNKNFNLRRLVLIIFLPNFCRTA